MSVFYFNFCMDFEKKSANLNLITLSSNLNQLSCKCNHISYFLGSNCYLGKPNFYYLGYPNSFYLGYPNSYYLGNPNSYYLGYPNSYYLGYPNSYDLGNPNFYYLGNPTPII